MTEASRRAVLAGLAAMPFAGLPAVVDAAPCRIDPIYAAIAHYRLARAAFEDVCPLIDHVAARQEGRVVTPLDREIYDQADDREVEAMDALVSTAPTTVAGLLAALAYISDLANEGQVLERFVQTVVAAPPVAI